MNEQWEKYVARKNKYPISINANAEKNTLLVKPLKSPNLKDW